MKTFFRSSSIALALLLLTANLTNAHVTVQPDSVGIAARQTFNVSVPNEKDNPTVSLRLVIPASLQSVTPNVKPGWKIDVKKTGEGEEAVVTEITWSNGSIPTGQRDDFLFRAQAPAQTGELVWKAYQTYQDGTVVAWDQDPASVEDGEEGTPFSTTVVVDDISTTAAQPESDNNRVVTMRLSITALALSVIAIGFSLRKK